MKKKIRLLSVLSALFIIVSMLAAPVLAALEYVDYYVPSYDAVIGSAGKPVTVSGSGSFTVKTEAGEKTTSFGMESVSEAEWQSLPYPVITRTFPGDGVNYTLTQFASEIGEEEKSLVVFTKLFAENSGKDDVTLPAAENASVFNAAEVPVSVPAGKTVTVEYYTVCDGAPIEEMPGTFDSHMAEMTAYWDSLTEEGFRFTSFPDEDMYKSYASQLIDEKINGKTENVCLETAEKLLCGELADITEVPEAASLEASEAMSGMTELSGEKYLVLTGGVPVLEDNLNVLVTLKSYSYICRKAGDTARSAAADEAYSKLVSSVVSAFDNTAAALPGDWKCATVSGSADKLTFALDSADHKSAAALCRWYVLGGMFSGEACPELSKEAENAFDSLKTVTPDSLVPSVISETESGNIYIGRGCPASLLSGEGAEISFENYALSDGTALSGKISTEGNEITVSVTSASPVPVIIAFPVFRENIEYASCGFDFDTGVVTAPAGMSVITVRLITEPSAIVAEREADTVLETSVLNASGKDSASCTTVSAEIFNKAYDNAVSARVGTAEGKIKAASELDSACEKLSGMIAVYDFNVSDGTYAGKITSNMIMQKFTTATEGDLSRVTVKGEYKEGTFAAVYTLRKDGYTTDRLVCETDGVRIDGGVEFDFGEALEKETEYVLCIFNETGGLVLDVLTADISEESLYIRESGVDRVCRGASLDVCFSMLQADRTNLDTFYNKCVAADTSEYTKESVNALNSALKKAKESLCTPSVTKTESKTVYENLKKAYSGLETYASDEKKVHFPIALPILVISAVAVVAVAGASVIIANVRKSRKEKEDLSNNP